MEQLHKLGIKIDLETGADLDLKQLIPVFQRWIQDQAVAGHLLIDVHDYSHVPHGPGILLVAHEGNFHVGEDGDRLGLTYTRKQPLAGDPAARVGELIRITRDACQRLETEPELGGARFVTGQVQVFANDRLLAPNTAATAAAWQPVLESAGLVVEVCSQDPRDRLAFSAKTGS